MEYAVLALLLCTIALIAAFVAHRAGRQGEKPIHSHHAIATAAKAVEAFRKTEIAARNAAKVAQQATPANRFYALEAAAVEGAQNSVEIFDEILTLFATGPSHRLLRTHAPQLLIAIVTRNPRLIDRARIMRLMELVRINDLEPIVGYFAATMTPLPVWAAFPVAHSLDSSQKSVVVERLKDEFHALFIRRYQERFPGGLAMPAMAASKSWTYKPADEKLPPLKVYGLNPLSDAKHFQPLAEIWNGCIGELRRLSSVVAKHGQSLTPQAWEAMPQAMRAGVEHPSLAAIKELSELNEESIVNVAQLAEAAGLSAEKQYTPSQSRRIAEVAEQVAFGVEPDPRLSGEPYRGPDRIALLANPGELPQRRQYAASAYVLRIGLAIAAVDGMIRPQELAEVLEQIQKMFQLNPQDLRRIKALANVLSEGNLLDLLAEKSSPKLTAPLRQSISRLIIAVVASDGAMTDTKRIAIDQVCTRLGLSKTEIDAIFQTLAAASAHAAPNLDHQAIQAIMQETREVAAMLADAMAIDETELVAVESPKIVEAKVDASQPPARYAELYRVLIVKDRWPLAEANSLARQMNLMLSGALEALNEWAQEMLGSPVFSEDAEEIVVDRSVLGQTSQK